MRIWLSNSDKAMHFHCNMVKSLSIPNVEYAWLPLLKNDVENLILVLKGMFYL